MSTTVTIGQKRKATREESVAAVKRSRRQRLAKKSLPTNSVKFHNFIRTVSTSAGRLGYNLNTGFSWNGVALGNTLQFSFTLAALNIYAAGASTAFAVLALPNYTELTALYDQYRIDWVEMQIMFSNNQSSVNTPATTLPILWLAKDYDDTNNASITDIQQYATQQCWQVGNQRGDGKHVVRVKPNVDTVVYQSALVSGYGRGKPQFIDTSSPQVPHYGIKIAADPINSSTSVEVGYFSIACIYHLTMGHTK